MSFGVVNRKQSKNTTHQSGNWHEIQKSVRATSPAGQLLSKELVRQQAGYSKVSLRRSAVWAWDLCPTSAQMHTYTHADTHVHTCRHTRTHMQTLTYTHADTHVYTRTLHTFPRVTLDFRPQSCWANISLVSGFGIHPKGRSVFPSPGPKCRFPSCPLILSNQLSNILI